MCMHCRNPLHLTRRSLLVGSATAFAAGMTSRPILAQTAAATAPNAISPDEALQRIMEGNSRYIAGTLANKDFSVGRAARAVAQYPIAAILSCADSRVSPELAFDQAPGELFVVRLAGNFVNNDGLASIEYGTRFLGVPLIMVLGHSDCGAMAAAIKVVQENTSLPGHLPDLVNALKPAIETARQRSPADLLQEATAENVRINVRRLSSADPVVSEKVRQDKVKVVGGVYDIGTGRVSLV
jgi:carbonic anhydrase